MQIKTKQWLRYISKMSQICKEAADQMQEWVRKNGFGDTKALLDYAYALASKYGSAIGTLSCQMYDETAAAQGVLVDPAEPAPLPDYHEVAKVVNGAKKQSELKVPDAVGRMVKQVGADTTLYNAQRDGAQFAWVPHGDTCAFCIVLASRGWQYMSKKALRGSHAEHIHANCDCQYAIRFGNSDGIEGYDPDKYREMYNNAEGKSPKDKINSMRRENYKRKKMEMNLQFFAKVPDEKLRDYALDINHKSGGSKALAFKKALGYTQENYKELKKKVLEQFNAEELVYKREDKHGKRYEQILKIDGPNGKTANVLTAWIKGDNDPEERLTSIYITDREK